MLIADPLFLLLQREMIQLTEQFEKQFNDAKQQHEEDTQVEILHRVHLPIGDRSLSTRT